MPIPLWLEWLVVVVSPGLAISEGGLAIERVSSIDSADISSRPFLNVDLVTS